MASGRRFLHQITGTPSGVFGELGGVAVDGHDDVWVAEQNGIFNEFEGAGSFIQSLALKFEPPTLISSATSPDSLAIMETDEQFLVTGEGTAENRDPHVEAFDATGTLLARSTHSFGKPAHVAVDNSANSTDASRCELATCTMYVDHAETNPSEPFGDGMPWGVEKFTVNGKGEMVPVPFTDTASYILGDEITGSPADPTTGGLEEPFGPETTKAPGSVAIDTSGDIYVVDARYNSVGQPEKPRGAVLEFDPEGAFMRAFTGEENPGLGQDDMGWGVGPEGLRGVAVDPITGDVLVSVMTNDLAAIDEFDSTGKFISQITEAAGEPLESAGEMTFDSSGDLYFVDPKRDAVDVFGSGRPPAVEIDEASERIRTSAVLNGSLNPEGGTVGSCEFEYVTQGNFEMGGFNGAKVAPCGEYETNDKWEQVKSPSEIPATENFHKVRASIASLVSGESYRFRLVANTLGKFGGTAETESSAFTSPATPHVDSATVVNISSESAEMRARINPLGAPTTYYFEYGTTPAYGTDAPTLTPAAPQGASIGSGGPTGDADASVAQQIDGLAPGVTYHYRVVAESHIEGTDEFGYSEDATFTALAQSAENLPDKRSYELLTPSNKGSAEDMFAQPEHEPNEFENRDFGNPSESGEEFLLETTAAFGSFAASGHNAYVFRRDETGWQTLPVASPSLGVQSLSPGVFDPANLSHIEILDRVGAESSQAGVHEESLFGPPGGPYDTILSTPRPENESVEGAVGASRDLSNVVVQTVDPPLLASGQAEGSHALYEWKEGAADGECTVGAENCALASIDPSGSPFRCGAWLGQSSLPGSRHNAVSADGSKIIMTSPDPYAEKPEVANGCWNRVTGENAPQLYIRSKGKTVELSTPEAGWSPQGPTMPSVYVGANESGSKVFFVSETELTRNDRGHESGAGAHDPELYECEMIEEGGQEHCELSRLSAGAPGSLASQAGSSGSHVYTVPAISADGKEVYFTAFGALTSGAPNLSPRTQNESPGPVNLYRYDTTNGTTAYVGTVDMRDYPQNTPNAWWLSPSIEIPAEVALDTNASWYTTPSGHYLLYMTTTAQTGYSTAEGVAGTCPVLDSQNTAKFGHCDELYRYNSQLPLSEGKSGFAENPVCVSCDPSGASPVSDAFFGHDAADNKSGPPAAEPVRAMSDDGAYVFFDSADPLVKSANNHTQDVYEWEEQGAGACDLSEGCVHLISSGEGSAPSYFLGTSADGSNVFFGTHSRLTAQDTDEAGDLYDARIGGGFPGPNGSGSCEGAACESPPLAPVEVTPASSTFSGPGNGAPKAEAKTKSLTKTSQLARALKACKKKRASKRHSCEVAARKRYGKQAKKAKRGAKTRRTSGRKR
ncbi:MAG TPA: hypothetical protein VIJ39_12360 [Solirubrobacteraceae bacterium]